MHNETFLPGLHIIAGDHGSGNTVVAANIARIHANGGDFLGRKVEPRGVAYVALKSRPPAHMLSGVEVKSRSTFDETSLKSLIQDHEDLGMIVLDPAHLAIGTGTINATAEVAQHFDHIYEKAIQHGIAVILVHFLTKFTKGNARERIAGCAYWSTSMITRTTIEPLVDEDPTDMRRRMIHYGCADHPIVWDFSINRDGTFAGVNANDTVELYYDAIEHGQTFLRKDMLEIFKATGLSESTLKRWLVQKVKDGEIQRVEGTQGTYFKNRVH